MKPLRLANIDTDDVGRAPTHRQFQIHLSTHGQRARQEQIDLRETGVAALRSGIRDPGFNPAYRSFHRVEGAKFLDGSDPGPEEQQIDLIAFGAEFHRRRGVSPLPGVVLGYRLVTGRTISLD